MAGAVLIGGLSASLAVAVTMTAVACTVEAPLQRAPLLPAGVLASEATFDAEVGPLLEGRCGDAACHGRPERPLPLYAPGARRLYPADTFWKGPLKPAEVAANYRAVLGFIDDARPRRTTLLRKAVGELGHGGKRIFEAWSDPACRAVEAWLLGEEPR